MGITSCWGGMPKRTWRTTKGGKDFEVEEWDRWEAWQRWRELDWIECEDDDILLPDGADVVIYRDAVFKQPKRKGPWRPDGRKKSKWVKVGERLVIAEVIEYAPEIDDWIYLRVLRIEGYEADEYRIKLERYEMETRKKRRNLRGLKRLAWTDEDVRARLVSDPGHSRFMPETEDRL